jgi:microsomal dipeptidase-like Zn-dependent dipeptidase
MKFDHTSGGFRDDPSVQGYHEVKTWWRTLDDFTAMVARTADLMGVDHIGMGSDLCQDQPDSVVAWMRNGRWTKGGVETPGLGKPVFPPPLAWFRNNLDWDGIAGALGKRGFSAADVGRIMGGNWHAYFMRSFGPQGT